ncbi:tripartite tricarboxylate transporter substrate binding protein [Achromobacter xylosoxidans]|uniref:Tripartite tricarboxylate transporter substrate binding protein n=1 Tax=Alcaligenes xylosoxydans xylosoxydans TaxID=85698 RepID=A0A424WKG5_ALCXX|nr:tripartite tricarboxylate transporter substrate binding protein [Achromobacter xylosoxidans]RPJ93702.1 tripartite tricarboxylate transporter substrate binding protein [Achromobacter xylosoxidans]
MRIATAFVKSSVSNPARRRWARLLLAAGLASSLGVASAADWPTRPVKIVVPFAAGGTTDLIARLIATPMSQELGQPVVVENRPGVGGLLGADAVAKAAPDGYTVLMANISYPLAALVAQGAKRLNFDPLADLRSVSVVANVPLVITSTPSVPARNLKEFADLLKKNPSTHYAYGSTGPGSYIHVFGMWFQEQTGASMTHVPFKGAAPLKGEMLAGRIQMGGDQLSSSLSDIRAGSLTALAVTSPQRSPSLPDTPTASELGFTGIDTEGWNGLLAPAQTPDVVVARIGQAVSKAVQQPAIRQRLAELGAEASGSSPEQMSALLKSQFAQFGPMVSRLQLE